MRLNCPHCGERSLAEFLYYGDATVRRPQNAGELAEAWIDYVYTRENPNGAHRELWYHAAGCHAWLVVIRDLKTHEMIDVKAAREVALARIP